jgi:phosphate:Na+ symporter
MLRIVSEIESIGDANFNLSRFIRHKRDSALQYTDEQEKNIEQMLYMVTGAQTMMVDALDKQTITRDEFFQMSNMEAEINNYRDELKNRNMAAITEHEYDYSTGANYMDIVRELEKLADYVINIEEAIYEHKHDK